MFLIYDGFDHETVEVLRGIKNFLNWAHVGNCILDKEDPLYGDMHPGLDHPKSAITPEILKDYFRTLMDIEFEGGIGLEVMPYGDQLSESVIYNGIAAINNATAQIVVNYAIGSYRFKTRRFMPERLFYRFSDYKIKHPEIIKEEAKAANVDLIPTISNLLIIAADHPARYVTSVQGDDFSYGRSPTIFGTDCPLFIR